MSSIKFHSMPVYNEQCIKAKVKEFNGIVNTNFWTDNVSKEGVHYTCIAVMKIERTNYPQVHLKKCKYKIKKKKISRFIDVEL